MNEEEGYRALGSVVARIVFSSNGGCYLSVKDSTGHMRRIEATLSPALRRWIVKDNDRRAKRWLCRFYPRSIHAKNYGPDSRIPLFYVFAVEPVKKAKRNPPSVAMTGILKRVSNHYGKDSGPVILFVPRNLDSVGSNFSGLNILYAEKAEPFRKLVGSALKIDAHVDGGLIKIDSVVVLGNPKRYRNIPLSQV